MYIKRLALKNDAKCSLRFQPQNMYNYVKNRKELVRFSAAYDIEGWHETFVFFFSVDRLAPSVFIWTALIIATFPVRKSLFCGSPTRFVICHYTTRVYFETCTQCNIREARHSESYNFKKEFVILKIEHDCVLCNFFFFNAYPIRFVFIDLNYN